MIAMLSETGVLVGAKGEQECWEPESLTSYSRKSNSQVFWGAEIPMRMKDRSTSHNCRLSIQGSDALIGTRGKVGTRGTEDSVYCFSQRGFIPRPVAFIGMPHSGIHQRDAVCVIFNEYSTTNAKR